MENNKNYTNSSEIPLGLGIALAQNLPAMNYFAALDQGRQRAIIDSTNEISSKEEMQTYVNSMFEIHPNLR